MQLPCQLRPGEVFKAKKLPSRRAGSSVASVDVLDEKNCTGHPDQSQVIDDVDLPFTLGEGACVKAKLDLHGDTGLDIYQPLVLRTPRDAKHFVT